MKASKKTKSLGNPAATKPRTDGYDLPSHDALAQILPNYSHLFNGAKSERHRQQQQQQRRPDKRPDINRTFHIHHPLKRPPLRVMEDDPCMAEITALQTKEVENYRSAMSKMADDIIALRTQVVALEAKNSQLRIRLSPHQDLGRDLLEEADVMTKAEAADCITSLRLQLASEINKAASQRDRIQQLQSDLIKKNDSVKELLKLQRVPRQQEKTGALEATEKQQEKVIEKMGKALDKKLSGDKRLVAKKQSGETDHRREALAAEDTRLREELDGIHLQPAPTKDVMSSGERLRLRNKLEKAEAKVQTLEAQLEENSKLWGRQKQEMLIKLSEHRHGFVRTSTTILHNVPLRSAPETLNQKSDK